MLNPLPVELINFSVKSNIEGNPILTWQTANELNTTNFIIESSIDGINFTTVNTVAAKDIGNNSYIYTDLHPFLSNAVYYRLKIIDKDGNFSYSKVVVYSEASNNVFVSVAPNPTSTNTTLYFKQSIESAIISVFNNVGQKVLTNSFKGVARNTYTLKTTKLQPGIYTINVKTQTGSDNAKIVIY